MCTQPIKIENEFGELVTHAQCRKCKQCRDHRKRRWIGKLLAEEQDSVATWFVTFTYRGGYNNPEAYMLNYEHLKGCWKRIRSGKKTKGFPKHEISYFAVGEHGTEGDRAHWHAIIYWKEKPPDLPMFENINGGSNSDPKNALVDYWWPHGHVRIETPRSQQGCAVYLIDYMGKDNSTDFKFSLGLGHRYMERYARKCAATGTSLFQDGNTFTIPGNKNKDGKLFYYPVEMDSAAYHKMLGAFVDEWIKQRPNRALPGNEHVDEYIEYITSRVQNVPNKWKNYFQRHYDDVDFDPNPEHVVLVDGCLTVFLFEYAIRYELWHKGHRIWLDALQRPPGLQENREQLHDLIGRHIAHSNAPKHVKQHFKNQFPEYSQSEKPKPASWTQRPQPPRAAGGTGADHNRMDGHARPPP